MTQTLELTPVNPPRVSVCDYCGERKQLLYRIRDTTSGVESFACFGCSGNDLTRVENGFPGPFHKDSKKEQL